MDWVENSEKETKHGQLLEGFEKESELKNWTLRSYFTSKPQKQLKIFFEKGKINNMDANSSITKRSISLLY